MPLEKRKMIELENISFQYEGEESLFSSLSFKIYEKKPVLILSEPGSGKTSFARLLTGSAEKFYSAKYSGSFKVGSINLFDLDIAERKNYVARSSQNSDESILFPTVCDEVAFPLEQKGLSKAEIDRTLNTILERYDLKKYYDADTSELSGGEKKRLSLAVLDAIDPLLCVYDEAFDELSPSWRRRLLDVIRDKKYSITLGSHYLSVYENFFADIYELKDKKLIPYEKRAISFYFPEYVKKKEERIECSNISFEMTHRSSENAEPFKLSIPSFCLEKGSVTLLTGENGSGKSTLAKALVGIIDAKGSFKYDSKEIKAKDRKRVVSYLFQNPFTQLYLPTVYDELKSVATSEEEIKETSSLFSLSPSWYTQELSYGKAKLLQAAIFYIINRPFIVFDEIDSAISYQESERLLSLFLERGAGILMISHDERIISSFTGTHIALSGGKKV